MNELQSISTPFIRIDAAVVRRNIRRLANYAAAHGLKVRPHTKTHKSIVVGAEQMAAGAAGLTVAKAGEAEVMAAAAGDILVAYPAGDPARARKIALLGRDRILRVAVDSAWAVKALDLAAGEAGSTIGILVDLDVGMHRTGVATPLLALELARAVSQSANLRLDGLFCYPGHIRSLPDDQFGALKAVDALLAEAIELFQRDGLDTGIVSGGSTPSMLQSHVITAQTEIRPGTYVYNDMNTVHGGYCSLDECAARIVATVVSDAVAGKVVVDAGSKTLTMDPCLTSRDAGYGYVVEYPQAKIVRLSEEHGEIEIIACDQRPKIGERVSIVPNHICPCVNLQDQIFRLDAGGQIALAVDARGKLT